jgi:tRNA(Ile)-lysidine synthase
MRSAEEMIAAVSGGGLPAPRRTCVVLLSGGRDSSCLLDLLVAVIDVPLLRALHINYGLRDTADRDERWCRELCQRLDVPLTVVPAGPAPESGNLQAWARDVRYQAAEQIAGPLDAEIAVGHTADDQLETILYRLASSPSRRALRGMQPRSGRLVRPLLEFTRAETTAYCEQRGLAYVDDPTNDSDTYARNRVRAELIPALRRIHPGAESNVRALASILRAEGAVLDELVADVLQGQELISLVRLRELPRALARLAIQDLADQYLARVPAAGLASRTEDILAMGDDAMLDLPNGLRAVAAGGVLHFELTPRHNQSR